MAVLTGWGRTVPARSEVVTVDPRDVTAAAEAVTGSNGRGVIARGLGRSYGDPAQNSGGTVIELTHDDNLELDPVAGTVTAGGGVTLARLLEVIVPRGWFVPVTPGTRYVTVGGAIASDIHGKNHHDHAAFGGSFGNHVTGLTLMLADGTVVEIGPERQPDLFWATVGGMGLTGLILSATFRVIPIETSLMSVDTRRIANLDELMAAMSATDGGSRYSVAWLDQLATGRDLGRGVLTNADHATLEQVAAVDRKRADDPLRYNGKQLVSLPPIVPPFGLINTWTVKAFNEAWFRKAPRHRDGALESIPAYFHPLDAVGAWNRVYGKRGFLQYQFVLPHGAEDVLRRIVERISAAALPSFLTVLKRFGPGNPGMLSFPMGGWTLAVDVATDHPGLPTLVSGLDRTVLDAGGRHYLAKDAHMSPDAVERGYHRLAEWQAVRARVDPTGRWASDQSRRLRLTP